VAFDEHPECTSAGQPPDQSAAWLTSLALLALMAGVSAWGAVVIPSDALVAIHFDPHGRPDGFGTKWSALLALPPLSAAVLAGLYAARRHVGASHRALGATAVASTAVQAGMHLLLTLNAAGQTVDVGRGALVAQSMLFVVVGNYLPTTRRNSLLGIRFPWTLASDEVWRRTHALGGRLSVALGLATLAATLVSTALGNVVLLSGLLAMTLGTGVYSFRLSRR
jgi:uncharacterized membrane protein